MSGWIKVEKDLPSDPRFIRMARMACKVCNGDVTQKRCDHHDAVTQVLGSLCRLWIYADSHIREDDTLDLGPDEIDQVVGFHGFAKLMPSDWLEIIDAHRVKLPDFQAHNGTDAKKKALTAKRVARHRERNVTQMRNTVSSSSNASALPDQTRPDQTRPTLPEGAQTSRATATVHRLNTSPQVSEEELFEAQIRTAYPEFGGRQDWTTPFHHVRLLIERGEATFAQLLDGVHRFNAFASGGGVSGPKFVMNPTTFFSAVDKPWSQPWTLPPKPLTATEERLARERAELQELADGRPTRGLADFRDPYPVESPAVYSHALRQEELDRLNKPKGCLPLAIGDLAAAKRITP